MDFHPGNILIDNGKISGIVDWELSDWCTHTLDAFSALTNVRHLKELIVDYATAWDITSDTLRAVGLSTHQLATGAMEQKREARRIKAAAEGMKGKMRRRRTQHPVPNDPITSKPKASSVSPNRSGPLNREVCSLSLAGLVSTRASEDQPTSSADRIPTAHFGRRSIS